MTVFGILLTILLALCVGSIFYYVFKSTGPWGTFWSFIIILILAGLAAEAWITPIGPVTWGVAWAPTLLAIIVISLLLAAASPPRDARKSTGPTAEPANKEEAAAVAIGGFFWLLLFLLLGIALWGIID